MAPLAWLLWPLRKVAIIPAVGLTVAAVGAVYGSFELTTGLLHLVVRVPQYTVKELRIQGRERIEQARKAGTDAAAYSSAASTAGGLLVLGELFFKPKMPQPPTFTPVPGQSVMLSAQQKWALWKHFLLHYPYIFRLSSLFSAGAAAGLAYVLTEKAINRRGGASDREEAAAGAGAAIPTIIPPSAIAVELKEQEHAHVEEQQHQQEVLQLSQEKEQLQQQHEKEKELNAAAAVSTAKTEQQQTELPSSHKSQSSHKGSPQTPPAPVLSPSKPAAPLIPAHQQLLRRELKAPSAPSLHASSSYAADGGITAALQDCRLDISDEDLPHYLVEAQRLHKEAEEEEQRRHMLQEEMERRSNPLVQHWKSRASGLFSTKRTEKAVQLQDEDVQLASWQSMLYGAGSAGSSGSGK